MSKTIQYARPIIFLVLFIVIFVINSVFYLFTKWYWIDVLFLPIIFSLIQVLIAGFRKKIMIFILQPIIYTLVGGGILLSSIGDSGDYGHSLEIIYTLFNLINPILYEISARYFDGSLLIIQKIAFIIIPSIYLILLCFLSYIIMKLMNKQIFIHIRKK